MTLGETVGHHILIAAALAWGAGLALGEAYHFVPVAVMVLLLGLALFRPGIPRGGTLLFIVFLAFLYGQYRYWHVAPDAAAHLAGERVTITLRVAELPDQDRMRTRFVARAEAVHAQGRSWPLSGAVLVSHYHRDGPPPGWRQGDRFSATVRLRPITSLKNPGGFDYAAWMWRQGVRVRTTLGARTQVTRLPAASGIHGIGHWRDRMRSAIRAALPPETAALLTALTVGDARDVSQSLRERFQAAGLAHILAISGTHLGLLGGLVFGLAAWGFRRLPYRTLVRATTRITPDQVAAVLALAAVAGYALVAGGRTPTVRAFLMVSLVMVGLLSGRRGHAFTGLAAAGLIILAMDPRAIGEASFQLSFMAVFAILLALPQPEPDAPPPPGGRLKKALTTTLIVTIAAGLATAPLVAYHFGQASWPGFFANLLVVPLLGFVILPLCVPLAVVAPLVGTLPFANLVHAVLDGLVATAGWFAHLPNALVHPPPPSLPLVVGTYLVLVLILARRQLPSPASLVALAAVVLAWGLSVSPPLADARMRVAFLDVGQGDATVITGPRGDVLVIDGGTRFGDFDTGRLAVAPYLWARSADAPALLATHPQLDHQGGLTYLAEVLHPSAVYLNGDRRTNARFDGAFHDTLAARNLTPIRLSRGDAFSPLGGVQARVLHPAGPPHRAVDADNNRSLVVALTYGKHRFLFPGDIEQPAEAELLTSGVPLAATVLKVPHHGSATSSTAPFIDRVDPALAVISSGPGNRYRHPHPKVVAAFRDRGTPAFNTATDGAVLMDTDGTHLRVTTQRRLTPERIPPWHPSPGALERRNWQRLFRAETLWREVPT